MKKSYSIITLGIILIINTLSNFTFALNNSVDSEILPNQYLEFIKICHWKGDAKTCVNFSFDDGCKTHKKISEIFDRHNLKSTFFVNTGNMFVDSIKIIILNGHEIGNHTISHPNLNELDSSQIDFQIRKAKETIEKTFGIKCVTFAEPFTQESPLIARTVFRYHLFDRNYSEYPENKHLFVPFYILKTVPLFMSNLKRGMLTGNILEFAGHGIDEDGWMPITTPYLNQVLDSVNYFIKNGDIWVSTIKEGVQYENLYHELVLDRKLKDDTIILTFKNYNKQKYMNMEHSPISIEFPYIISSCLKPITDSLEITKKENKFIITVDLKRDTIIKLLSEPLENKYVSLDKGSNNNFFIYPNPAQNKLNLSFFGEMIQIQITDIEGHLMQYYDNNNSTIDVSNLKPGCYIINLLTNYKNTNLNLRDTFIKIK